MTGIDDILKCVCGHFWTAHSALTKTCQVEGCGCQVYHLTEVIE